MEARDKWACVCLAALLLQADGSWPELKHLRPHDASRPGDPAFWTVDEVRADEATYGKGVVKLTQVLGYSGRGSASRPAAAKGACSPSPQLREFVHCANATAIAFAPFSAHAPWVYGHLYQDTLNPLFNALARRGAARSARVALLKREQALTRAEEEALPPATRPVDLYLPAGAYMSARLGLSSYREAEVLFPEHLTGYRIKYAPWVPFCEAGKCARLGEPPPELRPSLALVLNAKPLLLTAVSPAEFKASAWRAIGVSGEADTITFMSTRSNTNGRRLANELELVKATRDFFAREAPDLRFVHFDHGRATFGEELAAVSRSAVFISLFGSSLHNCRFLPYGALVLQMHGALKNEWENDDMYCNLCQYHGARWLPYRVPGSIPLFTAGTGGLRYNKTAGGTMPSSVALVPPDDFAGRFLPLVLGGEYSRLFREFENSRRNQTNPRRNRTLKLLSEANDAKRRLPRQYRRTELVLSSEA
jgi:hypothetical protein